MAQLLRKKKLDKLVKFLLPPPTHDVKKRIMRYFPEVEIDVKYHPQLDTKLSLQKLQLSR